MGVNLSWTPTALGADFAMTIIQRYQEAAPPRYPVAGWFDVMHGLTESVDQWTDLEHRRGVAERYRRLVKDVDGIVSLASPEFEITATGPRDALVLTTNQNPALEREVHFEEPSIELPDRVAVHHVEGRFGFRLWRSTVELGEVWELPLHLLDELGPDLWRDVAAMLRADLPYVCVLDHLGNRWLAGTRELGSVSTPKFNRGTLPATLVEVATTPAVVVVP